MSTTEEAPSVSTVDAEDRGTVTIADRVVERLAGYAVTQVPNAAAAPRRVLGVSVGEVRAEQRPHVHAVVHGGTASVEITMTVAWPHPVAEVASAVRRRVRDDINRSTGLQVDHVDLDVASMDAPSTRTRVR